MAPLMILSLNKIVENLYYLMPFFNVVVKLGDTDISINEKLLKIIVCHPVSEETYATQVGIESEITVTNFKTTVNANSDAVNTRKLKNQLFISEFRYYK